MATPLWLQQIFRHYRVPFQEHRHSPVFSASHLAQTEHVSGYQVAKTVFLSLKGKPVAVVLPSCNHLDLTKIEIVLGKTDARLATEPEISRWFKGCPAGTIPPLRLRADQLLLMDRSLASLGRIIFSAATSEDALSMRFKDWYKMVHPGIGDFTLRRPANGKTNGKSRQSVLVVEDEKITNQLLCRLLERQGYSCHGVGEGSRAVVMASELRPSAILLDLMLPDMSGFDVCERLRRTGPLKRTPVIIVTALDDAKARQRGSDLGAAAYLTKPFGPDALVAQVREVLADCV